tara:strand:- start:1032 stop:1160 length:129 start_codon:yes stop_codon:yes gene_type:complete
LKPDAEYQLELASTFGLDPQKRMLFSGHDKKWKEKPNTSAMK